LATAGDQINRALRLLGVLAEGESPSASESADALLALNQMLDSWSTERLAVYATTTQSFTWPSGQASRTLGPTGTLVGTRPILLDDSTYFIASGISYPIQIINQEQYNSIALKTSTSTLPQYLFVDAAMPDVTITLFPVPTQDLTFKFVSVTPLSQPALLTTELSFPPGYMRAFAYNLAMEIAPEFGVEPSQQVKRIAVVSKRDIKRINNPDDVMVMPAALLNQPYGFNIYSGDF
jgi:hypothetical protein